MNRNEYIEKLRLELKHRKVKDINEIINEYNDHFEIKLKQGKTEEEIVYKLAKPAVIAEEFAFESHEGTNIKFQKITIGIGVSFIDFIMSMVAILLFSWIIVMGTFAFTVLILSLGLMMNVNIAELIPSMPYFGKLLLGISCLALSILSTIGTMYCYIYIRQWIKVYLRWHQNMMNYGIYPKLPLSPETNLQNINLRLVTMIALITFGVCFTLGFVSLVIYTGTFEFWHELNWFQ